MKILIKKLYQNLYLNYFFCNLYNLFIKYKNIIIYINMIILNQKLIIY